MNLALHQNIKAQRKAHKMTQEALAEALGVTVGAVYKWESGQSVPDILLILQMAELFDQSTDALLGFEWKRKNPECAIARTEAALKEKTFLWQRLKRKRRCKNIRIISMLCFAPQKPTAKKPNICWTMHLHKKRSSCILMQMI